MGVHRVYHDDAQFKIVVDARFMLINGDADDEEFWESRIMS